MSKKMTARKDDGLWVISEEGTRRWWTATSGDVDAVIMSDKLRSISTTNTLGTRIRAAVRAAMK